MFFGRWPEVMLADARETLLAAHRLLADKIDPMEQAKLDAIHAPIAQAHTFKAISAEWLERARLEERAPMTRLTRCAAPVREASTGTSACA